MVARYCLCVLTLWVTLCIPALSATHADDSDVLAGSRSNRVVKVGAFPCEGYHNFVNGQLVGGYGYDYLQYIRRYTSWSFEYSSPVWKWGDMFSMLESGKIDLLSYVPKTPETESRFAFSKYPIGYSSSVMLVNKLHTKYLPHDYANWNGIRVGLLKNSIWSTFFFDFAKRTGFSFTSVYYDTVGQLLSDLHAGADEIDAAVMNEQCSSVNEQLFERFIPMPFYIVVRKDDTALLNELDSAINTLNELHPHISDSLCHKYFEMAESAGIVLTTDEREYVEYLRKSGKQLTAVMNPDRAPISYFKDGAYHGAMKNIADEIIRKTGLPVRFIPVQTREEFYDIVSTNAEVDLVFDFINDLSRAEKLGFVLSTPYYATMTAILHRKDSCDTFQSIAYVKYSNEPLKFDENFAPNAKIVSAKTMDEAIAMVRDGKCDAMFLHSHCAEYAARVDWRGRLAVKSLPNIVNYYCIAVRDDFNPLLCSVIDKAVLSLPADYARMADFNNRADAPPISLEEMFYRNPALLVGLPLFIMFVMVLELISVLRSRMWERTKRLMLQSDLKQWEAASEMAHVYRFSFDPVSMHFKSDKEITLLLPVVDGVLAPVKDWLHPEDIKSWQRACNVLASGEKNKVVLKVRMPKDGKMYHFHISMYTDSYRDSKAFFGIIQNMTEFVDVQRQHSAALRLWKTCINIIPAMVCVKSADDLTYLQCNKNIADFIGLPMDEIIGKTDAEILKDNDIVERFAESDRNVISSGRTCKFRASFTDQQGRIHNFWAVKALASDVDGSKILIIMAIDETDEYKRRIERQSIIDSMDLASKVARIAVFKANFQTMNISGSKNLGEYWPIVDGKALRFKDVVVPEDNLSCEHEFDELVNGKVVYSVFDYHRVVDNRVRHYRIFMHKEYANSDFVSGIIQDITDFDVKISS